MQGGRTPAGPVDFRISSDKYGLAIALHRTSVLPNRSLKSKRQNREFPSLKKMHYQSPSLNTNRIHWTRIK